MPVNGFLGALPLTTRSSQDAPTPWLLPRCSPRKAKGFPLGFSTKNATTERLSCGQTGDHLLPGLHHGYSNVPSTHCALKGEDAGSAKYPILHRNSIKSPDLEYSFLLPMIHFSSILFLPMSSSDAVQATWKKAKRRVSSLHTDAPQVTFFP